METPNSSSRELRPPLAPAADVRSSRLGLQELRGGAEPSSEPSATSASGTSPAPASAPANAAQAPIRTQTLCVFRLAGQLYALDIGLVREIVKIREVRALPRVAPAILGACNLRGEILPVVAPELLLALPNRGEPNEPADAEPTLLIAQIGPDRVGLRIRRAESVAQVLEPLASAHSSVRSGGGSAGDDLPPTVRAEVMLPVRGRSVPVWLLEADQLRSRLDALAGRE